MRIFQRFVFFATVWKARRFVGFHRIEAGGHEVLPDERIGRMGIVQCGRHGAANRQSSVRQMAVLLPFT